MKEKSIVDLIRLEEEKSKELAGTKEMTFGEWLSEVFSENPHLHARSAHKYLVDAVRSFGYENGKYKFFEGKLFGVDEQLSELMSILESAAMGNDVKRRIILLLGPVGTAKSTTVYWLKRALEAYSRTEEGQLWAISFSPLHESPLLLLSQESREKLQKEYGIVVEGSLSPVSRYYVDEMLKEGKTILDVPVRRIYLDEGSRTGIATFAPGDPNSQDISDLVGGPNYLRLQKYDEAEGHPLGWSFNGAVFQANRGILEMIELYKAKRELLNALLTLAQERHVKPGRHALVFVDTVILAHTNYSEYNKFWNEPGNEAIRDRTRVVEWRYNLNWKDEENVYRLMIPNIREYDIDPWALKFASIVAVVSRLAEPNDSEYPAQLRLKMYAGEKVYGLSEYAVSMAKKKFADADGRSGISPRWMVDQISLLQVKKGYVATPDLMQVLRENLAEVVEEESVSFLLSIAGSMYKEYAESLMSEVVVSDFSSVAQDYFNRYKEIARAHKTNERVFNPVTGEWEQPDLRFLESIESLMGISSPSEAAAFRTELLIFLGSKAERGEPIDWRSHPKLEKAILKKISEDNRPILRAALTTRGISEEADRTYERILSRLISDHGYSEKTAKVFVDFYSSILRTSSE